MKQTNKIASPTTHAVRKLVSALGVGTVLIAAAGSYSPAVPGKANNIAVVNETQGEAVTNRPTGDARGTIVFASDFKGYGRIGDLVAEADLVVVGRADSPRRLAKYTKSAFTVTLQTFHIEEVLLGEAPAFSIELITFGVDSEHEAISAVLANGGDMTLPPGGFSGLPTDGRYLVFLTRPWRTLEGTPTDTYEVVGDSAQGVFHISTGGKMRRFGPADVIDSTGKRVMTIYTTRT